MISQSLFYIRVRLSIELAEPIGFFCQASSSSSQRVERVLTVS